MKINISCHENNSDNMLFHIINDSIQLWKRHFTVLLLTLGYVTDERLREFDGFVILRLFIQKNEKNNVTLQSIIYLV